MNISEENIIELVKVLNSGKKIEDLSYNEHNIFFDLSVHLTTDCPKYKYEKIWISEDYRLVNCKAIVLDRHGVYSEIIGTEVVDYIKIDLSKSHLNYLFRKHPAILKVLNEKKYYKHSTSRISHYFNVIKNNKFLFKVDVEITRPINKELIIHNFETYSIYKNSVEFDKSKLNLYLAIANDDIDSIVAIFKALKHSNNLDKLLFDTTFEFIEDTIDIRQKKHQYSLILSNKLTSKNKKNINPLSYTIIKSLTQEGLTAERFHREFGCKISRYKNTKDFSAAILTYSKQFRGWSKDLYLKKFNQLDQPYIEINENIIIIDIKNYVSSNALGSSSWCISYDEHYFKEYIYNYRSQYFIYDFNKDPSDPLSMIGITTDHLGAILYSHDKSDHNIMSNVMHLEFYVNYFSSLDNNLYSRIENSNKNIYEKISDFLTFDLTINRDDFQSMVNQFVELGVEYRYPVIQVMTNNLSASATDLFLKELDNNITIDMFEIHDGLEFFSGQRTPFLYDYYIKKISDLDVVPKSLGRAYFKHVNIHTFLSDLNLGSLFLMNLFIEKHSLTCDSKKLDLTLKALEMICHSEILEPIMRNSDLSSKLNIRVYLFALQNDRNDYEFKKKIIQTVSNDTKHKIIKELFCTLSIKNLSLLDLNVEYPNNIFNQYQGSAFSSCISVWLDLCNDKVEHSQIYEHLFSYLKQHGLTFFGKPCYYSLDNKIRKLLSKHNLLDSDLYFEFLIKSYQVDSFLLDHEMTIPTLNKIHDIYQNSSQSLEIINFTNELFKYIINNKILSAIEIKNIMKTSFFNLDIKLITYIELQIIGNI